MIKKLRHKFITISMLSVFIVLTVIVGAANIISYNNINKRADSILTVLADNGGMFPKLDNKDFTRKPNGKGMSPEAPFENRFFTVRLDSSGNVITTDTGFIAAISRVDAANFAKKIYNSGKSEGFSGVYKYRAVSSPTDTMIIFLDCSRDLDTFYSFLKTSLFVSLLGLLGVFILVLFFSRFTVKPIAETYAKQKQFITDASHELKTPLTIINANTEVIEMENGENEWTDSIKNQVKRLTSLTNNLVTLSRMDEESRKIEACDFSLSETVRDEAEPFTALAKTAGKTLKLNIQDNIILSGEEKSIRRLVSILLDNAVKYSDDGGIIELILKQSGKKTELTVQNSCSGIAKVSHDILFERFYRAETSRNSATGGYGIGLSLAKSIVESHNGNITAKSTDGKSIVFTVVF